MTEIDPQEALVGLLEVDFGRFPVPPVSLGCRCPGPRPARWPTQIQGPSSEIQGWKGKPSILRYEKATTTTTTTTTRLPAVPFK